MAFKLSKSGSYSWPVTCELPIDGGEYETQVFEATFKRKTQSWITDISKQMDDDKVTTADVARELVIGWSGITDDTGKDIPFSQAAMDQLLDVPAVAVAIVSAFFRSVMGVKEKN